MGLATINKISFFVAGSLLLGGCATSTSIGTIAGGECSLPGVHTPRYKVLGKIRYDQNWSDDVTEGLVRGRNQARPQPRPASFDRPRTKVVKKAPLKPIASTPTPTLKPAVVAPVKKKSRWWER